MRQLVASVLYFPFCTYACDVPSPFLLARPRAGYTFSIVPACWPRASQKVGQCSVALCLCVLGISLPLTSFLHIVADSYPWRLRFLAVVVITLPGSIRLRSNHTRKSLSDARPDLERRPLSHQFPSLHAIHGIHHFGINRHPRQNSPKYNAIRIVREFEYSLLNSLSGHGRP